MGQRITSIKRTVAAFAVLTALAAPVWAQQKPIEELYQDLLTAGEAQHERVANQIVSHWRKSGSPAMDLLLRRGDEAMEAGDFRAAIDHFSALVDHAPDFAEAYHSRASAYFQADLIGPALDDLQRVLRLEPRHFQALFGLGAILEGLERPAEALEVYRAVLAIYPLDPDTLDAVDRVSVLLEGRTL